MNNPSVVSLDAQQTREEDRIKVFMCECRVEMRVGYYPEERLKPQPVIVSVEVEAALPHHYQDINENSLDRVINYERFHEFIQNELPRLGHIPLLETVAEQIISFCMEDHRVQKVCVKLQKPNIFDSTSVGIEVRRVRPVAS